MLVLAKIAPDDRRRRDLAASTAKSGKNVLIGNHRAGAWFAGAVLAVTLALVASFVWSQPPAPLPADAPGDVFSAARAMARTETILGDEAPHPVGTEEHRVVADRISDQLSDLGYIVENQDTFTCSDLWALCSDVRNVLARATGPGDEAGNPAVLLTAHYDSVPAGPGAADDMASVAILLEIASMLTNETLAGNPVVFLFSDAEEPGLVGAQAFVQEHPWAADVGAVVNLEARGTHGLSLLFETSENNGWLIDAYAEAAPRPVASSLFYELYKVAPNNTDFTVYKNAGLPGVNFAFTEGGARYHTPLDNLEFLDAGSVQHQGDNTLAMVRALANRDLGAPPPGNVVYLDLIPGTVLRWPEAWTMWLAFGTALAWLAIAVRGFAGLMTRGKQIAWGVILIPMAMFIAMLLGTGVSTALIEVTGFNVPWYAEPMPSRVAIWTAAVAGMAAVGLLAGRRAWLFGATIGVWFWWVALSLLVSWSLPGASVMFLVPAIAGVLLLGGSLVVPGRAEDRILMASLIALAVMSWFWLPFALVAETMELQQATGAAVAAMVVLGLSPCLPLFALLASRKRDLWVGPGLLAAIVLAAVGWAAVTPAYSVASPQRLNVLQIDDMSRGASQLALGGDIVSADGGANVPEKMTAAATFAERPDALLPWSSARFLSATTARSPGSASLATVLEDRIDEGERRIRMRLGLEPGATRVTLYFPEEMPIAGVTVAETGRRVDPSAEDDGFRTFSCLGLSCAGREIELSVGSVDTVSFLAATSGPNLPAGAALLAATRPATAQPSHDGDQFIRIERFESEVDR